jgi:uncharacterized protein YnzC (UPF0291/DUF896 family)
MNIALYKAAIDLTLSIEQIEKTINELDSCFVKGRIMLRTDKAICDSYRYASVRHTTYIQFLRGEVKDHLKELKAIESEIKITI